MHCLATYGTPVGAGASSASHLGGEDAAAAMDTDAAAAGAEDASTTAAAAAAGSSGSGRGDGVYALDEAAVCLHFARSLLRAQPDWELAAFEEAWGRSVPEVR